MTAYNVHSAEGPFRVRRPQPSPPLSLRREGTALDGAGGVGKTSFSELLRSKVEGLKFSAHAASRMNSRNIVLTPELMASLEKAVAGAAGKGARDSLVITKGGAFIVNIPNKTVVTAMDTESMKENIFTNIDSAVIAE